MASIRLATFYQGGQMLAVHGRKTVCALKFSCVQNEGWGANVGAAELHDRCCPFVRYLGKKSLDKPHKKNGNMPGLFAYSGIRMPGSFFAKKMCWHGSNKMSPYPYFLPCKKKKPGSFHHPAICTALYFLRLLHGCQPISLRPHAGAQQ